MSGDGSNSKLTRREIRKSRIESKNAAGKAERDGIVAGQKTVKKVKEIKKKATSPPKVTHKEELEKIAKNDPEFFKFLREQDADLLQFNESDVESLSSDEPDEVIDAPDDDKVYDEADVTNIRTDHNGRRIVDSLSVSALREAFITSEKVPPWAVRTAVKAFMACVSRVGADIEPPAFVINDNKIFEEIIRLCFQHLGRALFEVLDPIDEKLSEKNGNIEEEHTENKTVKCHSVNSSKFRKWKKWSVIVKQYLHAVLLFLNEVQNTDVIVCTLRAIAQIVELYAHFVKLSKILIKSVVRIWSRKTLECRVASMLVLCKLVRVDKLLYPSLLKCCYFAYVSNVREVSAETCLLISFMQKAFSEITLIYPSISYPYAFIYIRQTAIHLRNAMIAKRKDLIQTVYNWQFIQCLYLWAHVISRAFSVRDSNETSALHELVYPLCQIIIATMRLFPSARYAPLRLHCIKILMLLQVNCRIYVPTLAQSIQLLDEIKLVLKKKPSKGKGTIKCLDMNCILKASTSQLEDAGFREAMLEELFKVQLEAAYLLRSSCAFSDVIYPLDGQLKHFLRDCRNADVVRLFKSLHSKLLEHAKWMDVIVESREVVLNDQFCMASLEATLSTSESPLAKFYESWHKIWAMQQKTLTQFNTVKKTMETKVELNSESISHNARTNEDITKEYKIEGNVDAKVKNEGSNVIAEMKVNGTQKVSTRKKKRKTNLPEEKTEKRAIGTERDRDELIDFVMSDSD
ncbi:unnamed protein product [Anisakis simplex]|uniref:Nucleolar complex protein 2 homolog (inferred by orthology to a C. elegans protein) n=1 Tax=Anisakis simplex TaxID=6269 RepID=A0A0M3JRK6_ANISI|nr:unnamed protein product [Anisakis simplex]